MKTLEKSGAGASVASAAVEETLADVLIPGNSLGSNGALRVTSMFNVSGSTNSKKIRIYLGSVLFHEVDLNAAAVKSTVNVLTIANQNNTGVQVGCPLTTPPAGTGASTDPLTLGQIDTTVNQRLRITGEKAASADEIHLMAYHVEYVH